MKPPDPKACAQIVAHIRGFHAGKQPTFLLVDDELPTVIEALEFCAREPREMAVSAKPQDKPVLYACYRIDETESE